MRLRRRVLLARTAYPSCHADAASSNVLVREDIRQHLIFKSNPEKYLPYVSRFKKVCF
jgi:hypothetical protein